MKCFQKLRLARTCWGTCGRCPWWPRWPPAPRSSPWSGWGPAECSHSALQIARESRKPQVKKLKERSCSHSTHWGTWHVHEKRLRGRKQENKSYKLCPEMNYRLTKGLLLQWRHQLAPAPVERKRNSCASWKLGHHMRDPENIAYTAICTTLGLIQATEWAFWGFPCQAIRAGKVLLGTAGKFLAKPEGRRKQCCQNLQQNAAPSSNRFSIFGVRSLRTCEMYS